MRFGIHSGIHRNSGFCSELTKKSRNPFLSVYNCRWPDATFGHPNLRVHQRGKAAATENSLPIWPLREQSQQWLNSSLPTIVRGSQDLFRELCGSPPPCWLRFIQPATQITKKASGFIATEWQHHLGFASVHFRPGVDDGARKGRVARFVNYSAGHCLEWPSP